MSENALFCTVDWRRYHRQVDRQGQPYYIRPPSPAGAMRSIATRIVGLTLAVNLAAIAPPIDGAEKRVLAHSGRGVVPDYRKQSLRSFVPLAAKGPRALHEPGN